MFLKLQILHLLSQLQAATCDFPEFNEKNVNVILQPVKRKKEITE